MDFLMKTCSKIAVAMPGTVYLPDWMLLQISLLIYAGWKAHLQDHVKDSIVMNMVLGETLDTQGFQALAFFHNQSCPGRILTRPFEACPPPPNAPCCKVLLQGGTKFEPEVAQKFALAEQRGWN